MELKDQVCSLELAQRLKALNVKQDSLFYHLTFINVSAVGYDSNNEKVWNDIIYDNEIEDYEERDYLKDKEFYSAFTVAELGALLPINVPYIEDGQDDISFFLSGKNFDGSWWINYTEGFNDINEANARAKMLIHLLEQGLMKNEF